MCVCIKGCDASILLDGSGTEKTARPNLSVRGYDLIDQAKAALESKCAGIVSCADIIVVATRDAVVLVRAVHACVGFTYCMLRPSSSVLTGDRCFREVGRSIRMRFRQGGGMATSRLRLMPPEICLGIPSRPPKRLRRSGRKGSALRTWWYF